MKNTKRILSVLLALVLLLSCAPLAFAEDATIVASGYCGGEGDDTNLTWTLDSEGTLTVSGTGIMNDYFDCYAWDDYDSQIKTVVIEDGVKSIGEEAFLGCTNLTSVTIPDSVTSIGGSAFDGCSSLTSVTIGNSVTSIGGSAFYNCSSLTSVTIPDSVTWIGDYAFEGCSSLKKIYITDLAAWVSISGLNSLMIYGSSQKELYLNGELLQEAVIPDGVTSIGYEAFSYCSSLTSVTIPDSVTSIGGSAFSGCSSLTSVTIPDSVTSIGWYAFSGCESLTSVTIPGSVTSIDRYAFSGCSSLTSVTIPDSVTSIGDSAFYNCSSLTSVTFGDSVTSIGVSAFSGCDALQDVYYDGSVIEFLFIDIGQNNLPLKKANIHCHEHEIAEVTDVTPATCTQPGVKTGVCACGQTLTEEIPALGHSYLTTVTPATCTTVGYTICKCERCDHQYVSDFENALGHADADANGNCTRCGVHLKDAAPTTEPTNPTEPTTQPTTDPQPEPQDVCPWCGGQHEGFFQGIVAWFHSLLAGIFGAKY